MFVVIFRSSLAPDDSHHPICWRDRRILIQGLKMIRGSLIPARRECRGEASYCCCGDKRVMTRHDHESTSADSCLWLTLVGRSDGTKKEAVWPPLVAYFAPGYTRTVVAVMGGALPCCFMPVNAKSTSGRRPDTMSAIARPEPQPMVQPSVPWPVFRNRFA